MKRCSESRRSIAVKRSNHTMDFTRGRLFLCNAFKSIITSLVLLWRSKSTFPTQTPKFNPTTHLNLNKLGLKTLIFNPKSHDHRHIVHKNYKLAPPSPSPQFSLTSSRSLLDNTSSWTSSMMDDLLGTDSGVPFMATSDEDMFMAMTTSTTRSNPKRKRTQGNERVKREFPPPIPFLAQTGNLQCRMPWNLTRHYSNGRLVLQEEKAQHHDYFEAERDNGRLVLKLVPQDNTIVTTYDLPPESSGGHLAVCEENDEELEMENVQFAEKYYAENDNDDDDDADDDGDDDDECDNNVDESKAMLVCNSVPQSHSEISRYAEKYGNMYFTKSAAIHEQPQNYFAHPASAPLRPITTAVI
ncbi:hypothetical protein ACLB2K_053629 [Fragaria x ananassa]